MARLAEERAADVVVFDDELSPRPAAQPGGGAAAARRSTARSSSSTSSRAAPAPARAACRWSWRSSTTCCPRLTGKGVLLSRLGGGIGTRGPGETKLETDRRRIRQRIQSIKREIEKVRRDRAHAPRGAPAAARRRWSRWWDTPTRASRRSSSALTRTATDDLGPALHDARPAHPQGAPGAGAGRSCWSDTVGFIQKLPHALVAAFRATLEEVAQADLLLHVMDASAEDLEQREAAVEAVLKEIGAADRPRVARAEQERPPGRADRPRGSGRPAPGAVLVSALTRRGPAELRDELVRRLDLAPRSVRLRFAASDRARDRRRLHAPAAWWPTRWTGTRCGSRRRSRSACSSGTGSTSL